MPMDCSVERHIIIDGNLAMVSPRRFKVMYVIHTLTLSPSSNSSSGPGNPPLFSTMYLGFPSGVPISHVRSIVYSTSAVRTRVARRATQAAKSSLNVLILERVPIWRKRAGTKGWDIEKEEERHGSLLYIKNQAPLSIGTIAQNAS